MAPPNRLNRNRSSLLNKKQNRKIHPKKHPRKSQRKSKDRRLSPDRRQKRRRNQRMMTLLLKTSDPRRWFEKSRRKTMSICRRCPAKERPSTDESPRATS